MRDFLMSNDWGDHVEITDVIGNYWYDLLTLYGI
jgi:hypothetical protein